MAGDNSPAIFFPCDRRYPFLLRLQLAAMDDCSMGEAPMTAGGGNLIGAEVNRKEASCPVDSCDL